MKNSDRIAKAMFTDAFGRIKDERFWTQGRYAVDELGQEVEPTSLTACKWCSTGALARSAWKSYETLSHDNVLCRTIQQSIVDGLGNLVPWTGSEDIVGGARLVDYNDTHTHAEVIAIWEHYGRLQNYFVS